MSNYLVYNCIGNFYKRIYYYSLNIYYTILGYFLFYSNLRLFTYSVFIYVRYVALYKIFNMFNILRFYSNSNREYIFYLVMHYYIFYRVVIMLG